jgi:acetyl esterase/lipase
VPMLSASMDNGSLLTKKSLELSLSPPRCPPFDTAHRSFLLGTDPSSIPYADYHDQTRSDYNGGIRARRLVHITLQKAHRLQNRLPHPHLAAGPDISDQVTRFLGTLLPLSWQNHCRDSGGFRDMIDSLVTTTMPLGALANPRAAMEFGRLTEKVQRIAYGDDEMRFIDMFLPECSELEIKGLVFFVHGGAWGSGKPWFYRLVASHFLRRNLAVAIVGYRVYPVGNVHTQVRDLETAALELSKRYPNLCGSQRIERPIGTCVIGHSSGAHIAFLMIVEQAKRRLYVEENRMEKGVVASAQGQVPMPIDSFVGLSGPYDVSHHYDYEGARGVEGLSPMAPACGYTRENFLLNSPALRLKDFLTMFTECDKLALDNFLPRMLLLHGIEDDTVPFTSTGEAARVLRACGVTKCQESYVPATGHQDTVMHLMLGGKALDIVQDWLLERSMIIQPHPAVVVRSKL